LFYKAIAVNSKGQSLKALTGFKNPVRAKYLRLFVLGYSDFKDNAG
jgi:hypothetical protein